MPTSLSNSLFSKFYCAQNVCVFCKWYKYPLEHLFKKCIQTNSCTGDTADKYHSGLLARSQRSCRSRWLSSWAPGGPLVSTRQSELCCDWQPPLAGDWGGSGGWGSRGRGHLRMSQWSSPPAQTENTSSLLTYFFLKVGFARPFETATVTWGSTTVKLLFVVPCLDRGQIYTQDTP